MVQDILLLGALLVKDSRNSCSTNSKLLLASETRISSGCVGLSKVNCTIQKGNVKVMFCSRFLHKTNGCLNPNLHELQLGNSED